jgi:hypothetical protein
MVTLTKKQKVNWSAPIPLWTENSSTGIRVREGKSTSEPAILRFANDTFMDDLLALLNHSPRRLSHWIAQPETWRQPMKTARGVLKPGPESTISYLFNRTRRLTQQQRQGRKKIFNKRAAQKKGDDGKPASTENLPLKLFQAGHQRYYLVSASLLLHEPGYPDQKLEPGRNERATFVVRRLVPPDENTIDQTIDNSNKWDEYACIVTLNGTKWKKIDGYNKATTKKLIAGEDQLPLFPVSFQDSCGHNRSIYSGLIPVGKRETWMAAPADNSVGNPLSGNTDTSSERGVSQAKIIFQTDVTAPWKILVEQAQFKKDGLNTTFSNFDTDADRLNADKERARRTARDQIQTGSWYILLDFAKFLESYMPDVWAVAKNEAAPDSLSDDETELYNAIVNTRASIPLINALVRIPDRYLRSYYVPPPYRYLVANVKYSLMDALVAVRNLEQDLEDVDTDFVRYDERGVPLSIDSKWPDFLFPLADPELTAPVPHEIQGIDYSGLSGLDLDVAKIEALAELVEKIVPAPADTEELFSSQPVLDQREAWFVIRCVYERPNCGPLFPALVSAPTRAFQMAPFFDPDAPARPVRIPMPVDISPAGLRKYKKNAAFVISDMLCGKIKKIRKITLGDLVLSVLPWPFHKDLPNPGDAGPCSKGGTGFGMICSLSIPIVTLCALIVMIIMVTLFDLFFRWIPYLFICLPIPGLKGKKRL